MAGNTPTDAAAAVASGSARGPVVPEPHTSPAGRTAFAGVTVLALALAVGVVVSGLTILEYIGVRPVLAWLRLFRRDVATVGAQVRAGGPLQYPTIASMYLEVVFALGLGVLLGELDRSPQPG